MEAQIWLSKERDEVARQLKESNSRNGLLRDEVREANKKLGSFEKTVADLKTQANDWSTAKSRYISQIEAKDEQITNLEYRLKSTCLESSIRTRAQLMREYLDGKEGTWNPHKDIEAEVEFDKMMASGGPSKEGFTETPDQEDVLALECNA